MNTEGVRVGESEVVTVGPPGEGETVGETEGETVEVLVGPAT